MQITSRHFAPAAVALVLVTSSSCGGEAALKSGTIPSDTEGDYATDCPIQPTTRDCANACDFVHCCDPTIPHAECMDRCEASNPAMSNGGVDCLALRIFWIDEEGCGSIMGTYHAFDDENDVCLGPRPY